MKDSYANPFFELEEGCYGEDTLVAKNRYNQLVERFLSGPPIGSPYRFVIDVISQVNHFAQSDKRRFDKSHFSLTRALLQPCKNCLSLVTLAILVSFDCSVRARPVLFEGHIAIEIFRHCKWVHLELASGLFLHPAIIETRFGKGREISLQQLLGVHLSNSAVLLSIFEKKYQCAELQLRSAIQHFPDYAAAKLNLAIFLHETGRTMESRHELTEAFRIGLGKTLLDKAIRLQAQLSLCSTR